MATTSAPKTRSVTDQEAYEFIAKLFSKKLTDQIAEALAGLREPQTFVPAVRSMGRQQGLEVVDKIDLMDLYNGFWSLYNGVDLDLSWSNDAGLPQKSYEVVEEIAPTQKPVPMSDDPSKRLFDISFDWGPFHGSIHI
ncbi:hypothetical protein AB0B12_26205 [Streptomyces sp. NPDC044780]|uniref:hypothetical protein n=1 Tax=unclassified Streptomyces TaxID=2593676 RepID=UPI003408C61B